MFTLVIIFSQPCPVFVSSSSCNLEISVYIMKTAKTNEKYYNSEIPSNTTIIPNCNSLLLYQNNSSWVSAFIQQPQI